MKIKDSITKKISLITIGSLLFLSGYFIINSYTKHLNQKENAMLLRLSTIAQNVASQINGDQYEALIKSHTQIDQITSNEEQSDYKAIHQILKKAFSVNQLNSPVYTLTLDKDKELFFFGVTSQEKPYFRHSYSRFPKELINQYKVGGKIKPYEDEYGDWLSAFAPIKNKYGNTVGIIQVDERLEYFCSTAKKGALKNILISLLLVGLFTLLLQKYLNKVINLMKEKEIAEQKAAVKAKFLSTMSHEIRTPMNAVIGLTNILMEENPRADQEDNLKTLKFSADMLLALINDVLDFSKIEAGKINFEHINFNLHQLINNIGNAMGVHAKRKNLPLKIEIAPDVPNYIIGDAVRLSQILTNLSGNAIKFTSEGSVKIKLNLIEQKGKIATIRFAVKDTGIGISKDKFKEIFKSFSQADAATTRKFGGTGLGLSITKKLLELQNSDIMLDSEIGKGSTFYFDLEVEAGNTPIDENKRNTVSAIEHFKGVKILLVEDNKINIIVAKKFLTKWGFDIDVAENGKEAVDKVKANDYEIVLMDLDMPVMDGYEATTAIRNLSDQKYQDLPIIALSASAVADFREKAMEVGMNEYVTKPFKPEELNTVLSRHIQVPA